MVPFVLLVAAAITVWLALRSTFRTLSRDCRYRCTCVADSVALGALTAIAVRPTAHDPRPLPRRTDARPGPPLAPPRPRRDPPQMTHPDHALDLGPLRIRLQSMLDEHLDRADGCEADDPALQEHLTAAMELSTAIDRVDHGTYGRCRRCKEPISSERLDAVPAAVLCISCARQPRPLVG